MKYAPALYAQAFASLAARATTPAARDVLVKNLVATAIKHGDTRALPKIAALAEKLLAKRAGANIWRVEVARSTKETPAELLRGLAGKDDLIETEVRPELVAGLRITQNNEREFDATLATKLTKLFAQF
ncbi:MAG TPA: F0F1 ATP synthase subunit delta [Candidatus Paceibacterota bacterium]|nr:F0F1 ATP synthase subunit delta [Candidatus Paceibacterota bacterium]